MYHMKRDVNMSLSFKKLGSKHTPTIHQGNTHSRMKHLPVCSLILSIGFFSAKLFSSNFLCKERNETLIFSDTFHGDK